MPVLVWHDHLLLGVREIDQHHKQLLKLIDIVSAELEMDSAEPPVALLNALHCLSVSYFGQEERFMSEKSFPGLAGHKKEHDAFIAKVLEARQNYCNGRVELLKFLASWTDQHFMATNSKLRLFLSE